MSFLTETIIDLKAKHKTRGIKIRRLDEAYNYDIISKQMLKSNKEIKDQKEFLSKMNAALKELKYDQAQMNRAMNDDDLISDTMAAFKSNGGTYGK